MEEAILKQQRDKENSRKGSANSLKDMEN